MPLVLSELRARPRFRPETGRETAPLRICEQALGRPDRTPFGPRSLSSDRTGFSEANGNPVLRCITGTMTVGKVLGN